MQTALDERQRNYIEKVGRSAEALLGILNDILDFSKIEAGKLAIERIDFNLEDVLGNLSAVIGLKAEEKGLELIFDLPADLPVALVGDPLRLGQILTNLGNNAVKFTERGEIFIGAEVLERDAHDCRLHFSVRDTGIGLTTEQQCGLFQSFSQADASITRRFGGTGLGLVISKRLTELMGGAIWIESTPGVGSTFHFTVELGQQQGAQRPPPIGLSELGAPRLLVVDDNASARETLSAILASLGLRVETAASGEEALARLRAALDDPYRLVLLDWKMPGLDGVAAARAIAQSRDLSPPPSISCWPRPSSDRRKSGRRWSGMPLRGAWCCAVAIWPGGCWKPMSSRVWPCSSGPASGGAGSRCFRWRVPRSSIWMRTLPRNGRVCCGIVFEPNAASLGSARGILGGVRRTQSPIASIA